MMDINTLDEQYVNEFIMNNNNNIRRSNTVHGATAKRESGRASMSLNNQNQKTLMGPDAMKLNQSFNTD